MVRGIDLIYDITEIFQMHNIETEIIAASVRNPIHVIDCAKAAAAPTRDTIFGSVDEAVRMGADAVSMGAMTLGDFQGEQFAAIGRFSEECMAKGMPLIGHVYPKGELVPVFLLVPDELG